MNPTHDLGAMMLAGAVIALIGMTTSARVATPLQTGPADQIAEPTMRHIPVFLDATDAVEPVVSKSALIEVPEVTIVGRLSRAIQTRAQIRIAKPIE